MINEKTIIRDKMRHIHRNIIEKGKLNKYVMCYSSTSLFFTCLTKDNINILNGILKNLCLYDYYEINTVGIETTCSLKQEYDNWKFKENIIIQCKLIWSYI